MIDAVCLTLDLDWAHDAVLAESLELLAQYGVRATIFATHKTDLLDGVDHEIAVHPDFTRNTSVSTEPDPYGKRVVIGYRDRLDEYLQLYPQAKGVRPHCLVRSTPLLDVFAEAGFIYESGILLPGHSHLQPTRLWNGLIEIPMFFEDDLHMRSGKSWSLDHLPMNEPGLKVFNFHPDAIFINAISWNHIMAASSYYHDPKEFIKYRDEKKVGIGCFFRNVLNYINTKNLQTRTLVELVTDVGKPNHHV